MLQKWVECSAAGLQGRYGTSWGQTLNFWNVLLRSGEIKEQECILAWASPLIMRFKMITYWLIKMEAVPQVCSCESVFPVYGAWRLVFFSQFLEVEFTHSFSLSSSSSLSKRLQKYPGPSIQYLLSIWCSLHQVFGRAEKIVGITPGSQIPWLTNLIEFVSPGHTNKTNTKIGLENSIKELTFP